MESKNLDAIQTIAKICRVVSIIVFACCLAGGILCVVGMACVGTPDLITVNGVTVHSIVDLSADVNLGVVYASLLTGLVFCIAGCVLGKLAKRYFDHELAAGTPFTFEGANEIMRLGIFTAVIPLGAQIIAHVGCSAMARYFEGVTCPSVEVSTSFMFGVALIVMSVIFRYGAELRVQS
ncbi:hypothetical protein AAY81_03090 [Denitrobacterium detoxificans]|uniref:DUF2975 domain-containing protein n=1 Tax=Denitrobacterium detoxificans TaxID=79604 RepID=A0A172RX49_9ACTN|nr:hypothetical protein [Denitrobacterium detoxificans]ANE22289.1 hypothetical protein AAY81_03090 [Denitrobacterium detoxificans]SEO62511.1 hypothetical protein SAMN02910314_00698 [Denitrobacterium detoxificans]